MKVLHMIALVLVIVGGLNWGLIGLFGYNVIGAIFALEWLERLIYIAIGVAAAYMIYYAVVVDRVRSPTHTARTRTRSRIA